MFKKYWHEEFSWFSFVFYAWICSNVCSVFRQKADQMGPKWGFSSFINIWHLKCLNFLHKITFAYRLKIDFCFLFFCTYTSVKTQDWLKWFFWGGGKMLFWSFFMTKMRFSKFFKKSINLFWFFSVMLQQHKGFRFYHVFIGKKILLGFLTRISPKWFF